MKGFDCMKISAKTRLLAVVGNPIRHSLSPKIHNYLCEKLELDYVYTAFESDSMLNVLSAMRNLNICGLNVTSPFKYDALKLVDVVSDSAKLAGSVNTIVNDNGILTGDSTDGEGLFLSMKKAGINITDKKILILGAGGAAKPICVMLKQKGACEITILNRTVEKARILAEDLNKNLKTEIFSQYHNKKKFDIIINTTSVGMGTNENPLPDASLLDGAEAAVDIIYHPKKTEFLKSCENKGLTILNGIGMLVYQGILAFELFTGTKVPESLYEEVLGYIDE